MPDSWSWDRIPVLCLTSSVRWEIRRRHFETANKICRHLNQNVSSFLYRLSLRPGASNSLRCSNLEVGTTVSDAYPVAPESQQHIRALMTIKAAWKFSNMFWDALSFKRKTPFKGRCLTLPQQVLQFWRLQLYVRLAHRMPWGHNTLFIHMWLGRKIYVGVLNISP